MTCQVSLQENIEVTTKTTWSIRLLEPHEPLEPEKPTMLRVCVLANKSPNRRTTVGRKA